jgi:hypothetical protein
MDMNQLNALMGFADKNNLFGRGYADSASSYDPSSLRAQWAARMAMSGGGPDFFAEPANAMMAYARPQRFDEPMPTYAPPADDPLRSRVRNHLLTLLGGSR